MKKINFKKFFRFFRSKKFLIGICLIAAIIVGGIFAMTSAKKSNLYATALDNIAEARHYLKHGDSGNICVQFFSGTREEPYAQDGKSGKQTPFAIINVESKDNALKDFTQIEGTIKIGTEQTPVVLLKNPYDRNYATDLGKIVPADSEIEITLFISSTNHPVIPLDNVMGEDAISWKEALKAAIDHCGHKVAKNKGFEVYVKIVHDMAKDTPAFWYIQFICVDGGCTHFCVIAQDGSAIG